MGVGGQQHAPAALPPWKTQYPLYGAGMLTVLSNRIGDVALLIVIAWMINFGSWWAPGSVWTGAENLASHRDSIPGRSSQ